MTYIEELHEQVKQAERAAIPVTVELVKHDHDEKVEVDSRGTTKRTMLGGKPPTYLPGHVPVVATAPRLVDLPVSKEVGKVVSNDETARKIKLVSGTVRQDRK